jgi:translation initiation factor 1 (eIF-1/SUI1)
MAGRRTDDDDDDASALSHNPFRALESIRDALPAGEPAKKASRRRTPQVVLRLERKGPNGEEVTIVDGLELKEKTLESRLIDMKEELGCAGVVIDGRISLRGDWRERVRAILAARGVSKISVT